MSLSDTTADRLETATVSAHLATAAKNRPHVAPVWFLYDDGHLYAFTGGRKLANLRENPRVAASIEDEERIEEVGQRLFEKYTGGAPADEYSDSDGTPQGTLIEISIGTATVRDN